MKSMDIGQRAQDAVLPVLIEKAVRDAGFDLITVATDGGHSAAISGVAGRVWFAAEGDGVWVALPTNDAGRLGLGCVNSRPMADGMRSIGYAPTARALYHVLHAARVVMAHPPATLSARVEARLAMIPSTERTREVRQRIGQDVFREALFEMWDGRCAISGIRLPRTLLRASHAKPWADSDDTERLDPFNGLLLAVHYDALFDAGLIAVTDDGTVLVSPKLDPESKQAIGLGMALRKVELRPGHIPYLSYHRRLVAAWATGMTGGGLK